MIYGSFRDDTLHTNDENQYLSENLVLETIKNITQLIEDVFPRTAVYPALGNHDYHPKSQMPAGRSKILSGIADIWSKWLEEEKVVFEDGKHQLNIKLFLQQCDTFYF